MIESFLNNPLVIAFAISYAITLALKEINDPSKPKFKIKTNLFIK